jgi:uncharacterized membrane protein YkoI
MILSMAAAGSAFAAMTKEQIAEQALKLQPGEVKKIKTEKKDGRELWEVKIKDAEGRTHELYFDQDGAPAKDD